jgi:segregation and condensation protein A
VEFGRLFDPERGVPELVVTFLAILELAKEHLVNVTQQAAFAPIYVRLNDGIPAN